MTTLRNPAHAPRLLVVMVFVLLGCSSSETLAKQCVTSYPKPTEAQIAAVTISIPAFDELPVYRPNDSLPQIFSADSSVGWFRNLFHARFGAFRSEQEVRSFLLRFHARIAGRADTDGWYAVLIPDPGPDSSTFNLLQHCIGARYGVYVRSVYSRQLPFLRGDTVTTELPR